MSQRGERREYRLEWIERNYNLNLTDSLSPALGWSNQSARVNWRILWIVIVMLLYCSVLCTQYGALHCITNELSPIAQRLDQTTIVNWTEDRKFMIASILWNYDPCPWSLYYAIWTLSQHWANTYTYLWLWILSPLKKLLCWINIAKDDLQNIF